MCAQHERCRRVVVAIDVDIDVDIDVAIDVAIDIDVAECCTFSVLVRERNAGQVAT